jgi:type I restriction enzyme S subunit
MPKCPNAQHRTLEPRPSNPETSISNQHAIADYLDRETARIDALIEKKQRIKELLQERRQTLIAEVISRSHDPRAVTGGD